MEKPLDPKEFLHSQFKEFMEIRAKHLNIPVSDAEPAEWLTRAMEEYGKQMFNYALELASENANVKEERHFVLSLGDDDRDWESTYTVDKESILKLKIT